MAVAKSFQSFEIVKEPYNQNGRMYVDVRNPKNGNVRTVRWYDEAPASFSNEPAIKVNSMRKAFGFDKGYITIFKGDTYSHLEYFQLSTARYCKHWGWYFISTEPLPDDIPEDVTPIQLPWELVGEGEELKPEEQVKIAVESLIYEESPSQFVGSIGERLEIKVKVVKVIPIENNYGHSTMHHMEDEDGNIFVWTTASKTWAVGDQKLIRGTVKDHKIFRNTKETILTRCMERK